VHRPHAEKFDNQKPWAASFLFVRRGTQSHDEFIAAVPLSASPKHDVRDDHHVRHFLDWRKRKYVYPVGSQATCARALGTTRRQARDLLQGAGEVSSPRGIKRMEFSLSVRKKAFVRCCRDGLPHCEGCSIELNARAGIISEQVIPGGPRRRTDAGLAEDRRHLRQAGIEAEALAVSANRDDFQRAGERYDEIPARPRRGTVNRFREEQRQQEAGLEEFLKVFRASPGARLI
jgi:hypothetical protein